MRSLFTVLLFGLSLPHTLAQDTTLVLSTRMFDQYHLINLSTLKGWVYRPGHNPTWANPTLNTAGWLNKTPAELSAKDANPAGKAEGWFRSRIRLDSTFTGLPVGLANITWAAIDVYVNGQWLISFGRTGTNEKPYAEFKPYWKPPLGVRLTPGPDYLIALHVVDYVSPYPRFPGKRLESELLGGPGQNKRGIGLTGPQFASEMLSNMKLATAYITLWASVSVFIALFFWLLSAQKLYEKNIIRLLAISETFFALANLFRFSFLTDPSFRVDYINAGIGTICLWLFVGLTSVVYLRIFGYLTERQGVGIAVLASLAVTILALYMGDSRLGSSVIIFQPLVFSFVVISSWKRLRGAQWAIVVGVGLAILLGTINAILEFTQTAYNFELLYTGISLSIPLSLLVYVALRFNEILAEVQQKAGAVVQVTEEKRDLLATQNERLEQQVEARTAELRQQAQALRTAQDQLRIVGQQKERFFNNIAHEFRTPLSLILAPVEKMLADAELPNRMALLLGVVNRNARQLLSLINQLLDLSKLDAGQMKVSATPAHLFSFLNELVNHFRPQADAKGVSLNTHPEKTYQEKAYEWVLIDTDKWTKIMTNLLANALKYTPSGGQVSIQWRVANGQACLSVTDTGIGIEADKLPRIFDRFYQADDSPTRLHEGTGIGLSLVQELTDLLTGTISVASEVGQGTIVRLSLPVQSADPEPINSQAWAVATSEPGADHQHGLAPFPEEEATDSKPLVVVVEDNAELREFIRQELTSDYRVLTAINGLEAWEVVRLELPDLVVSDVMMPLMDGIELAQRIKTDPLTNHIAVVLLTARTAHQSRLEGLEQGADDYLTKPFHTNELQLRLRNLLTRRQRLQAYFQRQLAGAGNGSAAETEGATSGLPNPFLETLYDRIEAHLDDSAFSVDQLAREVGMSRRTLHRKLTALTDLSPQDFVFRYRLRRATDLLRAGRNVSETAYLVGYESVSHFSAMFKSFYHQVPSAFVKQ
ncbi:hybrid sensor histidine kinase/response regulator transcription factor [Spirosoma areae]